MMKKDNLVSFNKSIAEDYGIVEAIILNGLYILYQKDLLNNARRTKGMVEQSIDSLLGDAFPYLAPAQLGRALSNLASNLLIGWQIDYGDGTHPPVYRFWPRDEGIEYIERRK